MSEPTQVTPILDQFLSKSLEYLGSAEAFLKSEVPAFIQEFLAWKMYESLFYVITFLVLSVVCAIACVHFTRKNKETHHGDYVPGIIFSFLFTIVFFVLSATNVLDIIKIKVAPRVYLLEEVRSLTK